MEWNLRNRLEAAKESRRSQVGTGDPDAAADGETIDLTERRVPADTEGPARRPVMDFRTLQSVREARERTEREARAQAEADRHNVTPLPIARSPHQTFQSTDATIATIVRVPVDQRSEPIPTTRPAQERCPNCGGPVRIDMFDLVQAVAHLTCTDCGFIYTAKSPR